MTQSEFRRLVERTRYFAYWINALEAMHISRVRYEQQHYCDTEDYGARYSALKTPQDEDGSETLVPDTASIAHAIQLSPFTWDVLQDVPGGFWESALDPAMLDNYLQPARSS